MGRDAMRAADADRQQVADRLRAALEEGRLDLAEYDERLQRAFAAKTYGELDELLQDLPGHEAPAARRAPTAEWLTHVWGTWLFVVAITSGVWLLSSLASGQVTYFWPVWVGGPWGVFLVIQTIGGLTNGAPRKMVADRERRELAEQHRRERKALMRAAIERGDLPANPSKEQRRRFAAEAIERGELPPRPL